MADDVLRLPKKDQELRFSYKLSPRSKEIIVAVYRSRRGETAATETVELTLNESSLSQLERTLAEAKEDLAKLSDRGRRS